MTTDRKDHFFPGPEGNSRAGIYSVQMNIVFQDQTVMRFSDNPAVVFATSSIEARQKFEELASRNMEDQGNPVKGKVHPDLTSLRFVADPGEAEYVA